MPPSGFTDRNYLAGARLSVTEPLGRDWSGTAALDARTGRDMHVEGVFTNALTASLRAAKRFGDDHNLSLTLIVPPSVRGTRLSSAEEAFRLTGDRLYNPAWGFQHGKVRNSRVRREFVPLAVFSYRMPVSQSTSLAADFSAEYGTRKYSALGWYDARTPMPDNYRYLPGYTGDRETEQAWRAGDARYTQIDWDELIAQNRMAAGHAVYALEDRAERLGDLNFSALFTTALDARLTLRYGLVLRHARSRNFKQMRDLLGAEYITDIDQYLVDDDTYSNLLQNDLRRPGRTIRKGGRFGYDYALTTRRADARLHAEYRSDRFRADLVLSLGAAAVCRRGYYEKEPFPRRAVVRPFAPGAVYALYPQGDRRLGLLAPQLPRSVGCRRSRAARRRGPFLPAAVQQPRHRRSPSRTPLCRRNQLQPYGRNADPAVFGLSLGDVRRRRDPPLLRRHGGRILRHGCDADRTHGLRRRSRRRHPALLPLESVIRRICGALQIHPQPADNRDLRRRQFGRGRPCREPPERLYVRRRAW